jgi:hypothetical protein
MGMLLMILGFGWAIIGGANIVLYDHWQGGSDAAIGFLLMFNMLLFILPGLAVGGVGKVLRAKSEAQREPPSP